MQTKYYEGILCDLIFMQLNWATLCTVLDDHIESQCQEVGTTVRPLSIRGLGEAQSLSVFPHPPTPAPSLHACTLPFLTSHQEFTQGS